MPNPTELDRRPTEKFTPVIKSGDRLINAGKDPNKKRGEIQFEPGTIELQRGSEIFLVERGSFPDGTFSADAQVSVRKSAPEKITYNQDVTYNIDA